MIKFKELLERAKTEEIAVHTTTEKQAKALLKALDKRGYEWSIGLKLTTETCYRIYEEKTCYDFDSNNEVYYDSFDWHQHEGYTIIEFSEIDFEEE